MLALVVVRSLLAVAVLVALYYGTIALLRWDKRRQLESEHAAGAAPSLTREDYVDRGLAAYDVVLRRRVPFIVALVPALIGLMLGVLYWLSA